MVIPVKGILHDFYYYPQPSRAHLLHGLSGNAVGDAVENAVGTNAVGRSGKRNKKIDISSMIIYTIVPVTQDCFNRGSKGFDGGPEAGEAIRRLMRQIAK